ncbi:MAG: cytochrome c oxidase accessory protein CcoG [Bradyrhizobiaceae bacterium]|nr:cytochrome c oxidase accessory protein CcoG [Bradyrhizobiaceae bacterium]
MSVIDLDVVEDHERFRAELASIAPDGKRKWIYARKQTGKFYTLRTILSWFLLAFLLFSPFVKVGGHQFLLFNFLDWQFVFFGIPFWPSDFYFVALMFLTAVVTIVVFTSTLGRIWCGWLCPQTIFMEMVFRKIEWLIDGPPKEQARRDAGPWNWDRIWHYGLKVFIFFAISFVIANTFLSYIVSSDKLLLYIVDGPLAHIDLFIGLVFFTFVFFMVFFRFREQACVIACPYGRYMSALVDEKTIAVTYDFKRGEGRAKWTRDDTAAKKAAAGSAYKRPDNNGDCVDCFQCVTVCPTGIDIRNGIQMDCVNCTACIDACDEVMDKVGLPRGLIRYTSQAAVEKGSTSWFTPRIAAYMSVWAVLVIAVAAMFFMRSTVEVNILRQEGTTWVTTTQGLGNVYRMEIVNKSSDPLNYTIRVSEPQAAKIIPLGMPGNVAAQSAIKGRFIVSMPKSSITSSSMKLTIHVEGNGKHLRDIHTSFLSP